MSCSTPRCRQAFLEFSGPVGHCHTQYTVYKEFNDTSAGMRTSVSHHFSLTDLDRPGAKIRKHFLARDRYILTVD